MKGNKWKGAVSWLCIIALVLTSCFATFALPTNAFASEEGTVIDVTDFGADPSGQEDSAVPIQKAIEAAKEVDGPVTIYFPKGGIQYLAGRRHHTENLHIELHHPEQYGAGGEFDPHHWNPLGRYAGRHLGRRRF